MRSIFDCFLKREYITSSLIEIGDFKNPTIFLDTDAIYCGAAANNTLLNSTGDLNADQVNLFKCICLDFYLESCKQITTRFPLKDKPIKGLDIIDPINIKNGRTPTIVPITRLLPEFLRALIYWI